MYIAPPIIASLYLKSASVISVSKPLTYIAPPNPPLTFTPIAVFFVKLMLSKLVLFPSISTAPPIAVNLRSSSDNAYVSACVALFCSKLELVTVVLRPFTYKAPPRIALL